MKSMHKDVVRGFCCKVRALLKLTQGQMAAQMTVDKRTLQDWEAGKYMPITARLMRYVGLAPRALRHEFIDAVGFEALLPPPAVAVPSPARL